MSHIENKEKLNKLKDYLINEEGVLQKKEIEEILNILIPKTDEGKLLTSFKVPDTSKYRVAYLPRFNSIMIPKKKLETVSLESLKVLKEEIIDVDINKAMKYYEIFALMHEVEHALQFLISSDKIAFKYDEVKEGYKNIADILKGRNYILPHPITEIRDFIATFKYYRNDISYIFERNANVEACNDMVHLANDMEDFDIAKVFYIYGILSYSIGYINDCEGNMYETYKDLLLLDKYKRIKKDQNMAEDERLRFGLSVKEDTKRVLIKELDKFIKV